MNNFIATNSTCLRWLSTVKFKTMILVADNSTSAMIFFNSIYMKVVTESLCWIFYVFKFNLRWRLDLEGFFYALNDCLQYKSETCENILLLKILRNRRLFSSQAIANTAAGILYLRTLRPRWLSSIQWAPVFYVRIRSREREREWLNVFPFCKYYASVEKKNVVWRSFLKM